MRFGSSNIASSGIVISTITLLFLGFQACRPDGSTEPIQAVDTVYEIDVPSHFPTLEHPIDNAPTSARLALGKALFYDNRLSRDGSISCATCHQPDLAFTDGLPISMGVEARLGLRNAPSLANVAWHPRLFADGGVPTLELQILVPFDDHAEFDLPITEAAELLNSDADLRALSQQAYQRDFDPFVITRAIAVFERTLVSGKSAYDRYLQGELSALTADALEGMELFFSDRASCGSCHGGVFLTDFSYQNIGLYEIYQDNGRERVTANPADHGKFKVPSLRNVAMTAPYMHNGSIETLEQVIDHFDAGGVGHAAQHPDVKPLNLTATEKQQLLAFMHALTDEQFIQNAEHRP